MSTAVDFARDIVDGRQNNLDRDGDTSASGMSETPKTIRDAEKTGRQQTTNNRKKQGPKNKQPSDDANEPEQKPRQKSWNGCVTCKAKRAKCDETKPACKRCTERGWVCGGYKKKFVFKSFEETLEASRRNAARRRSSASKLPQMKEEDVKNGDVKNVTQSKGDTQLKGSIEEVKVDSKDELSPRKGETDIDEYMNVSPMDMISPASSTFNASSPNTLFSLFLESSSYSNSGAENGSRRSSFPETVMLSDVQGGRSVQSYISEPIQEVQDEGVDMQSIRDVQDQFEMISTSEHDHEQGDSSGSSPIEFLPPVMRLERFTGGSLDREFQLMHLYDKRTCTILTVSDGLNENGWREVLLPLSQYSPSLSEAIMSLTAFHMAALKPEYRVEGLKHSRKAIESLSSAITKPRVDEQGIIATTLVLCMVEIWDKKTTHSNTHVKGAYQLLKQRLFSLGFDSLKTNRTMRFLYNTYLYIDVISALANKSSPFCMQFPSYNSSFCLDSANDEVIYETDMAEPDEMYNRGKIEIDPLLGCSASLFPIIARAVSAANKLRDRKLSERLDQWTLTVLSQGIAVRDELIRWRPPANDVSLFTWIPSDPSCELCEIIQTSAAYRLSALLYLYEAVPQFVPDAHRPVSRVYNKILSILKSLPGSSRTVTVHLWPLLASSVYAEGDDRAWSEERFDAMRRQLCLGNVDAGWDIVRECWRRRDEANGVGQTCEGTLWLQVMEDWNWKLFLG